MQPVNPVNESLSRFIKLEHYRMHCAEEWADGPRKDAVLAAVHSSLERLEAGMLAPYELPTCMVCAARRTKAPVLMFPSKPKSSTAAMPTAA